MGICTLVLLSICERESLSTRPGGLQLPPTDCQLNWNITKRAGPNPVHVGAREATQNRFRSRVLKTTLTLARSPTHISLDHPSQRFEPSTAHHLCLLFAKRQTGAKSTRDSGPYLQRVIIPFASGAEKLYRQPSIPIERRRHGSSSSTTRNNCRRYKDFTVACRARCAGRRGRRSDGAMSARREQIARVWERRQCG